MGAGTDATGRPVWHRRVGPGWPDCETCNRVLFAAYSMIGSALSLTLLNPALPVVWFLYDSFIHYFTPVYPMLSRLVACPHKMATDIFMKLRAPQALKRQTTVQRYQAATPVPAHLGPAPPSTWEHASRRAAAPGSQYKLPADTSTPPNSSRPRGDWRGRVRWCTSDTS